MMQVTFSGTTEEKFALLKAIERHCSCERNIVGTHLRTCAPHQMMLRDQRAIDGLICNRRRSDELLLQEFLLPKNVNQ